MKSRHELREAVFKILFQVENTELDFIELLDLEQEEISTSIYVNKTLTEILEKKDEIDEIISKNLKDWKLERLSKMDRQILYSEKDESYKFINGVLKGIVENSTK